MKQDDKIRPDQVQFQGRWVDKKSFRTFLYNDKGEKRLVKSYAEYIKLKDQGDWKEENPNEVSQDQSSDKSKKVSQKEKLKDDSANR